VIIPVEWSPYWVGLAVCAALAVAGWLITLPRENVNLVDSLWPGFFLTAAVAYAALAPVIGPRAPLVLILVALWALRLSAHLIVRNWGKAEDRRYRAIRVNNSPGFAWKSLYIVFGLQAVLAWVISLPLFAAIVSSAPLGFLDVIGTTLVLAGVAIEAAADRQLARFTSDPANRGRVMDRGLWHYSRHPNYFGEATVWWGFFVIAAAGGGWWTLLSPILMTLLLLRVSGVTLLERDIAERRPGYRDYARRTNAFFPWPPNREALDPTGEIR
jgi:steroid 5-alpha reductase family enzyme